MEFIFRPITVWPGKLTANRKPALFKSTYSGTLKLLDHELRELGARNIVLQVAMTEDQIRLDGKPRAGSYPSHPGVILSFDSKFGPLSYPCDSFKMWEHNLRAIALSLQHLRAVDRYGVTKRGEQYAGWTALPAPASVPMTRDQALLLLAELAGEAPSDNKEAQRDQYRIAAFRCHPDRGGKAEDFKRLQQAKELLDL